MHVCLDVGYEHDRALAAGVVFDDSHAASPLRTLTVSIAAVLPYVSGRFFERELPCLMAVLERLEFTPETILVDGHVRLSDAGCPGLGMYLFRRLGETTPVIGVAKSAFASLTNATEITRGNTGRPLYITAAGIPESEAADWVRKMHGAHRVPTMLRLADQLSRGFTPPPSP